VRVLWQSTRLIRFAQGAQRGVRGARSWPGMVGGHAGEGGPTMLLNFLSSTRSPGRFVIRLDYFRSSDSRNFP